MKIAHIVFICAALCLGVYRFYHLPMDDPFLSVYEKKQTELIGVVIDEPDKKKNHINVLVRVVDIHTASSSSNESSAQFSKHNSLILASIPLFSDVEYGDKIIVKGIIKKPEVIISDDGSEFNYPAFLAKSSIFYLLEGSTVSVQSSHQASIIKEHLLNFKKRILNNIANALPTPHSFLAGGLIIAGKGSLDDELQEQFKRAGLIHIVVLSGFNITIVGQFIIALFSFFPPHIKNILGSLGILAFSVMAGGSATVIRSVIMSLIGLYARAAGRSYDALRGLLVAGVLMVVHNPRIVLYDPSFQLSFVATLGLILLGTPVSRYFTWVPEFFGMREIVTSTFATQIVVTPLILHLSGTISIVALFVNLLVLPLIPPTMLVVCITSFVSFIHAFAAMPFAFVSYIFLSYELFIVGHASALSFAAVTFSKISSQTTLYVYLLYSMVFIGHIIFKKMNRAPDNMLEFYPHTKGPP